MNDGGEWRSVFAVDADVQSNKNVRPEADLLEGHGRIAFRPTLQLVEEVRDHFSQRKLFIYTEISIRRKELQFLTIKTLTSYMIVVLVGVRYLTSMKMPRLVWPKSINAPVYSEWTAQKGIPHCGRFVINRCCSTGRSYHLQANIRLLYLLEGTRVW